MTLKAVLFDFNGIIINDEAIHKQLIEQLLLEENSRLQRGEFEEICLGRSNRVCIRQLLERRGRLVTEEYLTRLINRKAERYLKELEELEQLPIYPQMKEFISDLHSQDFKLGIVSGAGRKQIDFVLEKANLAEYFHAIVGGEDTKSSKPEPTSYLLAIERLNQEFPSLELLASECLAIEDSPAGIQAAKNAGIQVVGVANTYPFHMLQRCCNWTVDYLADLELERVKQLYVKKEFQPSSEEC